MYIYITYFLSLWNALPNDIKTCTNETTFRNKLITHLFAKFFIDNVMYSVNCVKRNRLFRYRFLRYTNVFVFVLA